MKRTTIASLGAFALLAVVPVVGAIAGVPIFGKDSVIAQNIRRQQQLELNLGAEKRVLTKDIQGKEKLSWQALQGKVEVKPGDMLRYTLSGENKSDRAVKNLTLNQPVPQGMVYVLKSANTDKNAKITYSIDGGKNFVENPTVKVTLPGGKVENKPAPAQAYTHIRWNFDGNLVAKSTIKGTYQLQVR